METESPLTPEALARQEAVFRECHEKADIHPARSLYHPDLVYLSPTFRIVDRPSWIMTGTEAGLEFIQAAFSQTHFDWDAEDGGRVRSNYVSRYRYHPDGRIVQQEIYYDPNGVLSNPDADGA